MADERFRIIFEGQGKELEETFAKLDRALENLARADPFERLTRTSERLDSVLGALTDRVSSGFGAVGQAVESLRQTLEKIPVEQADRLERGMERVRESTDRNVLSIGRMQQAFAALGHSATRAFDVIGSQGRQALEGIGRQVQGALSGIGGSLSGIGAGGLAGNLFSGLIEGARDAATSVLSSMNQLAQGVLGAAQSVVSAGYSILGELQKAGATAIGGLIGAFTPLTAIVGGLVGNAVGAALKAAQDLQAGLLNMGLSIAQGVADLATGAITAAVNVASQILNALVTVAQNVVERIAVAFSDLVGRVGGIVGEVVSKVTLGLTGLAGVAAAQSVKFRDQMAVVWGIMPELGREAFGKLVDDVGEIMSETPFLSWTEGARGLFAAVSAGIKEPTEAIGALRGAIDLAVGGGMRDLGTAMEAITRVMRNFKLEGQDAADAIFAIQDVAQAEVADIAQGIGITIEPALRAGVAIEDLGAMISYLSLTMPPAETFVSVARGITSMINPAEGAQKAFEEWGISLRNADGTLRPVFEIIDQLRNAQVNDVGLAEMFPNERAIRGIGLLVKASREELEQFVDVMENRTGKAAAAAEKATSTLGGQLSLTWSAWTGLIDAVVGRVEGPLMQALGGLQDFLRGLERSPGFNAVADSIGRVLTGAIELVESGLTYVVENHEEIEKAARRAWGMVETVATTAWGMLETTYNLLSDWVSENPEGNIASRWDSVASASREALGILKAYAVGDLEPLRLAFGRLWNWVESTAKQAWASIASFALRSMGTAIEALGSALDRLLVENSGAIKVGAKLLDIEPPTVPEQERKSELFRAQEQARMAERFLSEYGPKADAIGDDGTVQAALDAMAREQGRNPAVANWMRPGSDIRDSLRGIGIDFGEQVDQALESVRATQDDAARELSILPNAFTGVTRALTDYAREIERQAEASRKRFEERQSALDAAYEASVRPYRGDNGLSLASSIPPALLRPLLLGGVATPLAAGGVGGIIGGAGGAPGGLVPPAGSSPYYFGGYAAVEGSASPSAGEARGGGLSPGGLDVAALLRNPGMLQQDPGRPISVRIVEDVTRGREGVTVERSPFGLRTGGPQGIRIDTLRANFDRYQEMAKERRELLGGLSPSLRERVMGDLPEQYSLKQLRAAIGAYGPEPKTTVKHFGEPEQGMKVTPGQRGASWRGPAEGTSREQAIAQGAALAEMIGRGADAAEGAAASADKATSDALAMGEKLVGALDALAALEAEKGDAESQARQELLTIYEDLSARVTAELQKLRADLEQMRRAKEETARQFAGSKGGR